MSIQCQQCHATRAHLEPIVEYLPAGEVQQTVRCILCGWRTSRNLAGPVVLRRRQPVAPSPARVPAASHREKGLKSASSITYAPCAVAKCQGRYVPARNRRGWPLCREHRHKMWAWAKVPRSTPPPLIEIEPGRWDVNLERRPRTQGGTQ